MSSKKFHNRSTALEVIEGHDLTGYEIVITGGSAGIGVETVRALAKAGARIVVGARDLSKANQVVDKIKNETGNQKIEVEKLDLSSLKSVNEFVQSYLAKKRPLNVLVNNAGLAPYSQRFTEEGFELAFGTNHIGHFVLTKGLLPALIEGTKQSGRKSRVVTLSSFGHTATNILYDDINFKKTPYNAMFVYCHSKTANALFALALAKIHGDKILSFSVHPGGILSELSRELPQEEALKLKLIDENGVVNPNFKTTEQGASTTIYAVVATEIESKNGAYLEDCGISSTKPHAETYTGYAEYITSEEEALKLWNFTEELLKNIK